MKAQSGDGWNTGATYEDFMGRWSRPLAREFVEWIDSAPGGHWLDVGTGTGALAEAVCTLSDPASVVACDPSEPFVTSARERLADLRVTFEVGGVGNLPVREDGYDFVVSGLALNFFPDPLLAVREQRGLTRPGGTVAACVWDYAEGMQFLRHFWDAAIAIEPSAVELDEGHRFPICGPQALESLFRTADLQEVRSAPVSIPTSFSGFDDFWRPLLGGTGPAPSFVSELSEEKRHALVDELTRRLPTQSDRTIELQARAWGVAGLQGR